MTDAQGPRSKLKWQTQQRAAGRNFNQDYEALKGKYAQYRPNVKDSIIRKRRCDHHAGSRPDSVCYINPGLWRSTSAPGLTFEVLRQVRRHPQARRRHQFTRHAQGQGPRSRSSTSVRIPASAACSAPSRARPSPRATSAPTWFTTRTLSRSSTSTGKFRPWTRTAWRPRPRPRSSRNLIIRWGGKISDKVNIDGRFRSLRQGGRPSRRTAPKNWPNPSRRPRQTKPRPALRCLQQDFAMKRSASTSR